MTMLLATLLALDVDWYKDYTKALMDAGLTGKPLLIYVQDST